MQLKNLARCRSVIGRLHYDYISCCCVLSKDNPLSANIICFETHFEVSLLVGLILKTVWCTCVLRVPVMTRSRDLSISSRMYACLFVPWIHFSQITFPAPKKRGCCQTQNIYIYQFLRSHDDWRCHLQQYIL